jgi:hypothetical protein
MEDPNTATIAFFLAVLILLLACLFFYVLSKNPAPLEHQAEDTDAITTGTDKNRSIMQGVLNALKPSFKLDPVKTCEVYKKHGCSHVDGPLCDVETCTVTVEGDDVIPIKRVG